MSLKGRCLRVAKETVTIEDMGDGFLIEEIQADGEKSLNVRSKKRYRIFDLLFAYAVAKTDESRRLRTQLEMLQGTLERLQKDLKIPS